MCGGSTRPSIFFYFETLLTCSLTDGEPEG